jgi:hypothetical protein
VLHLSKICGLLHFPESDLTECSRNYSGLWSTCPRCLAWPRRALSAISIFQSLTKCRRLHFPESVWIECWGNYSGLWSTCPRLVAWPRLVLCAFSTLTSARLGTRCTLFLQDSNSSPSNARNQFKTSVGGGGGGGGGVRYSSESDLEPERAENGPQ